MENKSDSLICECHGSLEGVKAAARNYGLFPEEVESTKDGKVHRLRLPIWSYNQVLEWWIRDGERFRKTIGGRL